ncbi:MAG: histidine phosphatase family protein [Burkholderiaceae bacterium]
MTNKRRQFIAALVFVAAALIPLSAQPNEQLWSELKNGGNVVLIRHAITTPGAGDPPGFRIDDCSTQRNLTDEGRQHARKIGEAFRERGISVERVFSSPWCRCLETARLAFGKAEAWQPLSNLFGRSENEAKQVAELRAFVSQSRSGNAVLVTHGSTIVALTGISPATGEIVIVAPQGAGKFAVRGRLSVEPR